MKTVLRFADHVLSLAALGVFFHQLLLAINAGSFENEVIHLLSALIALIAHVAIDLRLKLDEFTGKGGDT